MEQYKISVIVPVYNAEKYLRRCTESILGQTYKNIELILVNDGSTDDSLRLCKQIAGKDPRVKVLDKPNGGAASARNLGLDHVTGDYIGFCDADDYLDFNMFEVMLKVLLENDLDTLQCTAKDWDDNGNLLHTDADDGTLQIIDTEEYIRRIYLLKGNVSLCVRLTRKDVICDIRIPEGRRVEDFYFTILLALRVKKNVVLNRAFYNCISHSTSVTRSATGSIYMDALYFYERSVERLAEHNICFPMEQLYYRMKMYYQLAISMISSEREKYRKQISFFKKDIWENRYALRKMPLKSKEKAVLQLALVSFAACRFAYLIKNGV